MFFLCSLEQRDWKRWQTLAKECQQRLTEQQITSDSPGTILQDVENMLQFVRPDGLITQSRNASLPSERLPELNRKSSYPIDLDLKRTLLRDYPNLAGIFILLRVMDLLQMKGHRLVVCPAALSFWRGLNVTEQYFALFEALLFHAQSSVLGGERRREEPQTFSSMAEFLGRLSDRWRNYDRYESVRIFGPGGELPPWNLFVQQQLGFIEIRRRPLPEGKSDDWGGRGWLIGGARFTSWGTAVTWALLEFLKKEAAEQEESESETSDEEAPDESEPAADFGMLQPIFQPYFPEWQTVYARPNREVRSGTHIFKITLSGWRGAGGSIWRRLAVPPYTSLDGLAGAILHAFDLDEDHLYDFRYRDQRGRTRVYNHPYTDEGPFTPDITVAETELALKDEMHFTFDYGDNWQFLVRLEKLEAGPCRLRHPRVIKSAGIAPEQYPQSEW
jgi:hypothetical protein